MNAGPFAFGFSIRLFTFTYSSTMPLSAGNAPVPIIAWPVGVFDGDAPTVACVNHAPLPMIDFRYGQSFGQVFSTSMPPESHTNVTMSFGNGRPGCSASVCAVPSGASNGKCNSAPVVGARSASVTGLSYVPGLM